MVLAHLGSYQLAVELLGCQQLRQVNPPHQTQSRLMHPALYQPQVKTGQITLLLTTYSERHDEKYTNHF